MEEKSVKIFRNKILLRFYITEFCYVFHNKFCYVFTGSGGLAVFIGIIVNPL